MAVAAATIWYVGPWSSDEEPQLGPARPVGAPVSVSGRTVSVLGAGDILVHPQLWDQARRDGSFGYLDFRPMMAGVRSTVSEADLALCHLETPVAPPGGPYVGFPTFSVPEEVIAGIKHVGYDGCSTASNHTIDQGLDGVRRTLDALDRAEVGHTGSYRSRKESTQLRIYRAEGVRIGHLSYTKSFNGLRPKPGQGWVAQLIDPDRIEQDARRLRAAGAEIVVVSLHWGTEYEHEPDVDQQTWARRVAAIRDVDVVFGHHAHVVQPVEQVNGKWIVYGMGNQLARHAEPVNANRDGVMIRVTFGSKSAADRWKVVAIEAIPTFVDLNPDIRLVDLERELADASLTPGRRRIYEAAVERIQGNLLTRSADEAGLVVRATPTPGQ